MSIISYILIALALSMDTFSLSLSLSLIIGKRKIYFILVILVAFLHFILPILGSYIGMIILNFLPISPNKLLGIIFILLFVKLLIDINEKAQKPIIINIFMIVVLAFLVSLDSLITGIGLSNVIATNIYPCLIFSLTSGLFTLMGLLIGNLAKKNLGILANYIGLFLLLLLAIIHLCK